MSASELTSAKAWERPIEIDPQGLPGSCWNRSQKGGVVSDVPPMNRSDGYRMLAEKVRTQAEATKDQDTREAFLEVADIWDRMAGWGDQEDSQAHVIDTQSGVARSH